MEMTTVPIEYYISRLFQVRRRPTNGSTRDPWTGSSNGTTNLSHGYVEMGYDRDTFLMIFWLAKNICDGYLFFFVIESRFICFKPFKGWI